MDFLVWIMVTVAWLGLLGALEALGDRNVARVRVERSPVQQGSRGLQRDEPTAMASVSAVPWYIRIRRGPSIRCEGKTVTENISASSRPYGKDGDLSLMRRFLSAATSSSPPQSYWHPGDLIWTLFQNTSFDPRASVRLWESGKELLSFAILEEPDGVIMQVHPRLRGASILEGQMLLWASERLSDPQRNTEAEIRTRALDSDPRLLKLLEERGFQRGEDYAVKMYHSLSNIPLERAPEGWTVRPVGGEEEWERRVELHRKVWAPSRVTLDAYRRLRTVSGCDPWLDLVAAGPDGTFGAYCICWLDPESKTGLFEPVGTHPGHRRRNLGRAVMLEGLRRLRNLGVESALVTCVRGNEAAARLYESAGFRVADKEHLYTKKLEA